METRVIRLEERSTLFETRLDRMEDKLDTIIERLARVPTRSDMVNYLLGTATVVLAISALVIGGLGWLETRAGRVAPTAPSAPAPIIIQLPPRANSAPSPVRTPLPH